MWFLRCVRPGMIFQLRHTFFPALMALLVVAGCSPASRTETTADPLEDGWMQYSLGEFDRAIADFEQVAQTEPKDSQRYLMATYGLATTWNLRRPGEDLEKALLYYRQILDLAPTNDLAAWSLLALARIEHLVPVGEEPDYKKVNKAYQDVIDRFGNHLAAKEAFIYKMSLLISSLKPEDAREALRQLEPFVQTADAPFLGPAYSLIAVAHQTLGHQEGRLRAEIRSFETTEIDPANPFNEFSWQYWNIATIAEFEVGDFDTARTYYRRLIAEYPRDKRVFGCKIALKRMDELEARLRAEVKK